MFNRKRSWLRLLGCLLLLAFSAAIVSSYADHVDGAFSFSHVSLLPEGGNASEPDLDDRDDCGIHVVESYVQSETLAVLTGAPCLILLKNDPVPDSPLLYTDFIPLIA